MEWNRNENCDNHTINSNYCFVVNCVDLKKQQEAILLDKQEQEYYVEQLQKTIEALQRDGIVRFIEYVKKVVAGEVLIEDETDPIWRYSYRLKN